MSETAFVELPEYNITLNITTIILVDWSEETIPEDLFQQGFVATVQLVNRTNLYIGSNDAMTLQRALHDYNSASGRGDINRNRTTFQEPTSKQNSNQKVAVAASGGSSGGGAARR
jgi:hypothetical protein